MAFKKGQSGNPKGRTPDHEGTRIRALTNVTFSKFVNEWLYLTPEQMQARIDNPETCALDRMIGKKVMKIMESENWPELEHLLNRMIGKVTENLNVGGTGVLDLIKAMKE